MPKSTSDHLHNDADRGKGSLEPDERTQTGNNIELTSVVDPDILGGIVLREHH